MRNEILYPLQLGLFFKNVKKMLYSGDFEVQCGHSSGNTYWKVHISIAQCIYCIFAHIMRYHSSVSDIFINAFLLVRNVIFKSVLLGRSRQFVYYTKVKFFKRSFVNMSHPHNSQLPMQLHSRTLLYLLYSNSCC